MVAVLRLKCGKCAVSLACFDFIGYIGIGNIGQNCKKLRGAERILRRAYIADTDQGMREQIASLLEGEGFSVVTFSDGDQLLSTCRGETPTIVLLDTQLTGTDGLTVCSELRRENPFLPIMIVSARNTPYDRVTGLTFGCDDYLDKPFLPMELVARIRALMRRSHRSTPMQEDRQTVSFGPLVLLLSQRSALLGDRRLLLTPTEFDFLAYLMQQGGSAVSRKELLKNLWELDWQADTRATDDLVKRLRRKLREAGSAVQIETVWGYGFRLSLRESEEPTTVL